MPLQIAPVICTSQQIYDYMGISAAAAAANILNGTTTLANYIIALRDRAATTIVQLLDYDYTTTQVQEWRGMGNGYSIMEFDFPVNTVTAFKSWNPYDPTAAVVDETTAVLTILSINQYQIFRNDKKVFDTTREYYIAMTQLADLKNPGGWPLDVIQIQCEMVAIMYRESTNQSGAIGKAEFEASNQGRPIKYKDMLPIWRQRLRPYRKISI